MIFLGKLFTVVGVAMLGVVGSLAQTEDTVGNVILEAIQQTAQLQLQLFEVNSTNFHSEGPEIASGLDFLRVSITEYTQAIDGGAVFSDDVAEEFVGILTGFVETQSFFLDTIVRKHSLAQQFFLTNPIHKALVSTESVVDAFVDAIINLIPTRKGDAQIQHSNLDTRYKEAITVYKS